MLSIKTWTDLEPERHGWRRGRKTEPEPAPPAFSVSSGDELEGANSTGEVLLFWRETERRTRPAEESGKTNLSRAVGFVAEAAALAGGVGRKP